MNPEIKFYPTLFSMVMVNSILEDIKNKTRRTKGLENINPKATEIVPCNSWSKQGDWVARFKYNCYPEAYEVTNSIKCPYGKPGDILWVRENGQLVAWDFEDGEATIHYENGDEETFIIPDDDKSLDWVNKQIQKLERKGVLRLVKTEGEEDRFEFTGKKQPLIPSIHMPKWTSRIFLKITSIKVERLQDITEEEAISEGVEKYHDSPFYKNYTTQNGWVATAQASFYSLWEKINGLNSWKANPWVWVIEFKQIEKPEKF